MWVEESLTVWGFRVWGFRGLGFLVLGVRVLGFRVQGALAFQYIPVRRPKPLCQSQIGPGCFGHEHSGRPGGAPKPLLRAFRASRV